jgi:hypothetical protein
MNENKGDPLERKYPVVRNTDPTVRNSGRDPLTYYHLLSNAPNDLVETWTKQIQTNDPGVTHQLSLTSVNHVYAAKSVAFQSFPDLTVLATEKIEGRDRVSFKHVCKNRLEMCLTFYGSVLIGKLVHITDVDAAKNEDPKLMRDTTNEELANYIQLDGSYEEKELVEGYESSNLDNLHLKVMVEEDMEKLLDDGGFVFSDDGKSFQKYCTMCSNVPCLWIDNQPAMEAYAAAASDDNEETRKRRHGLYRQMALIVNGGPSGKGVRVKLPECVVAGIRQLFPDPDAKYTGHRDVE